MQTLYKRVACSPMVYPTFPTLILLSGRVGEDDKNFKLWVCLSIGLKYILLMLSDNCNNSSNIKGNSKTIYWSNIVLRWSVKETPKTNLFCFVCCKSQTDAKSLSDLSLALISNTCCKAQIITCLCLWSLFDASSVSQNLDTHSHAWMYWHDFIKGNRMEHVWAALKTCLLETPDSLCV